MPKPSEAELKLVKHLWRARRLSAREIHEASAAETGWSDSSTRKTRDRMVDKGLVAIEPVHGLKTYAAARAKLATLAELIRDFGRNVLDTDNPLPTAAFAGSRVVDPDEIAELEALLRKGADEDGEGKRHDRNRPDPPHRAGAHPVCLERCGARGPRQFGPFTARRRCGTNASSDYARRHRDWGARNRGGRSGADRRLSAAAA